jgi:tetratricopeptide (TPR) repeat protein
MTLARTIQIALLVLLALVLAAPAEAQRGRTAAAKVEQKFPNATRQDTTPATSQRFARQFQRMVDFSEKDRFAEMRALADEVIEDGRAKPADRAVAAQNAAFAASQLDDYDDAIAYMERALAEDALSNNNHYELMRQAAQMLIAEDQYERGLALLDRFMEETRESPPDMLAFKGNALFRMERFEEAITVLQQAIATADEPQTSWRQLLMASYFELERPMEAAKVAEELAAASPDDKRVLSNLAAIYAQADQYDRATEVLERMRAKGMFAEERDYRQLYAMYLNMEGRENEAIGVINEGIERGVLGSDADVYVALGQAYYFTDRFDEALDAYRKAAPLAKDGEPALNLARLLSNEDRPAEAKKAAQDALARGIRRPGDAWMIIGRAEHGLDNRAGMIAAYREAAKHPETKAQAEDWLRRNAR